ncbi:hypothetical protein Tco_1462190, partial [Tanacetum coccineum]
AADHVVALTPGSAITIPKTANEFAIKGNHLTLVKGNQFDGRTKTVPHKHIDEFLGICDMFKNIDTENEAVRLMIEITQEVLNAVDGSIFLYKTPNQAYQLLEDKFLLKLDWAKNQKTKSSLKKTIAFVDEGSSNIETDKIMARMDAMTIKMDAQYKELQSRGKQPTPDLDDDDMPMSREEEAKSMQTFSCSDHVNVVFTRSGKSFNPPDNLNDQQNNFENPINFDSDDEDDKPTPQLKTQPTK